MEGFHGSVFAYGQVSLVSISTALSGRKEVCVADMFWLLVG